MKYCIVLSLGLLLNVCTKESSFTVERPYVEASKELMLTDFSKVSISGASTLELN